MKKLSLLVMALCLVTGLMVPHANATTAEGRGGGVGFLVGCCFGIRTTGEWNEGKDLHFRDWGRIVPLLNVVLAVWDGYQGYQGVTTQDLIDEYGSNYY